MIRIASATCAYCRREIVADLDERSTLDWGDEGDYGCGSHPLSDMAGCYGHQPADPHSVTLSQEVRGMFNAGQRGPSYVARARALAERLRVPAPA